MRRSRVATANDATGVPFGLAIHAPRTPVAVESLDGLAAGVYDVTWVSIAADVARGTDAST